MYFSQSLGWIQDHVYKDWCQRPKRVQYKCQYVQANQENAFRPELRPVVLLIIINFWNVSKPGVMQTLTEDE